MIVSLTLNFYITSIHSIFYIRMCFIRSWGSNWPKIKKFIYIVTSLLLNKRLRLNSKSKLLIKKIECSYIFSLKMNSELFEHSKNSTAVVALLVQCLLCWSTSAGRPFWCFGWQQWQLWAGKWRVDQSSKLLGNFFSNGEFDGKLVQNSCQIVLIWYRISWTFWYFYLVWWIGALILFQNWLHGHPITRILIYKGSRYKGWVLNLM